MKTIVRNTLLALMLLAWAGPLAAQTATKEQLVVALSAPGKPGTLRVKLVNGSIRVEGYSGKDVVIDVSNRGRSRDHDDDDDRDRGRSRTEAASSGMRRISQTQGLEVVAQEKDNEIQIKTQSHMRPVDLVVKVPRQFSLRIGTVNDGDIVVSNVVGELEVSNVNGSIRLDEVGGSAVLNTVNGDITAKFKDVKDNAPMAFSSVNGKIDVSLPPRSKAGLKLKTDRGEIYSDFDLAVDNSAPKATRTAKDGTYRVSVESWTYGKLNGGGAEMMMKTLNGDIYIRKAK
jgi:hypothetical protein